jgi:hypothetical protein
MKWKKLVGKVAFWLIDKFLLGFQGLITWRITASLCLEEKLLYIKIGP